MNLTQLSISLIVFSIVASPAFAAPVQTKPPTTAPRPVMARPPLPRVMDSPGNGQTTATYSALQFTVTTGDDDLRSDSSAWATLTFADNSKLTCPLRNLWGDTWDNGSTHTAAPCTLPSGKTYDDLKAARVELAYDGSPHTQSGWDTWGHTHDNWNVNEVRIEALNSAQHLDTCLIDSKGYPLIRMKKDSPNFALSEAPSTC